MKAIKYFLAVFGRHPGAIVDHLEPRTTGGAARGDGHGAADRCIAYGVVDQVAQHHVQRGRVTVHFDPLIGIDTQVDVALKCLLAERRHHVEHEVTQVHDRLDDGLGLFGIGTRQVEQLLDRMRGAVNAIQRLIQ